MIKKYFGTDGIRGEVGKSVINAEFILKLGWAAGKVFSLHQGTTVLIGKDTRISGYMLESALEAGFAAAGVNILLLGPISTPAVAYLTRSVRAHAGIMISASHNPYMDNGVKFFDEKGFKLSDERERAIEQWVDEPMQTVVPEQIGRAARMIDAGGRYIEFCKSTFPNHLSLHGQHVVLDCANGATYSIAPKIFRELGAQLTVLCDKPNGFNINQNCGATHTRTLQETVVRLGAHCGIALDGDGDRLIMVDEHGEVVNGDELLCIIALQHHQTRTEKIPVVGTVMSNLGLEEALNQHGIPFLRAPVGDRHVLDVLRKQGGVLGGEASGHLVNLNLTSTGDGIIAALQVLGILCANKRSLSQMKTVMRKRPQVLFNVPTSLSKELIEFPTVKTKIFEIESRENPSRVLLRPSGTESVLRIMVEGAEASQVYQDGQALVALIQELVGQFGMD